MIGSNGFIGDSNCDGHDLGCEDMEQEYQPTDADLAELNESYDNDCDLISDMYPEPESEVYHDCFYDSDPYDFD